MDTHDDVTAATTQALGALHVATDAVQPPENARAVVLGIAAIMIEQNLATTSLMLRRLSSPLPRSAAK